MKATGGVCYGMGTRGGTGWWVCAPQRARCGGAHDPQRAGVVPWLEKVTMGMEQGEFCGKKRENRRLMGDLALYSCLKEVVVRGVWCLLPGNK